MVLKKFTYFSKCKYLHVNIASLATVTKAVDKRLHYVGVSSLSIFGGNSVLAKVRQGLISVRC